MPSATLSPPAPSQPETHAHPRRFVVMLVFVLGILTATGPLATDLYLPAFPEMASDLGAPESMIQLTLTASMVGLALGQIVVGPMSDAWGRRVPLLVGVAAFTVASFACMLVPSAEALVVLRLLQGMAGAAGAVISRAVVRDFFDGDDVARFVSRLMLVVGLAPMAGPILGGQLLLFGSWRLLFGVLGVISLLSFVLVLLWLPESLPAERRRSQRPAALARTFAALLRDRAFVVPMAVLALVFGMLFVYVGTFSFVAQNELGASAQAYSVIFGINAVGLVAGTQVSALLIGRVDAQGRLSLGLYGSVLCAAGLALLSVTGVATLPALTGLLFVMMFGCGLVMPNATTLAITSQRPEVAGTASALIGSVQFATGGALAVLAGVTASGEATLASMTTVMLATGGLTVVLYVVGTRRQHQ